MKISLEALKRYVDINVPVEELCDRMVMAGFEIEEMEKQGENIKNICRYAKWTWVRMSLFR